MLKAQGSFCPSITNASPTSLTVCTESAIDKLEVSTTVLPSDTIQFVRFDTYQANPYAERGGVPVGEVMPGQGKATLRNVIFPAHFDLPDRIYYVYARLKTASADPNCTPFALITVFIRANPMASVVIKEATCYATETQRDGQVSITGYQPTETYEMAVNGTFSGRGSAIPADGVIVGGISRTGIPKTYTVRIYNSLGCYADRSTTMTNALCTCANTHCVPIVIVKVKSGRVSK
ncbi:hypothetical protein [Spirosoma radiotolerans]|uniref:hypothetical protein n=1 Tax=Spirosoma radiotolerans TaxID=1379870 RepID=UPI0011DDEDCB|nr:hypothetical protein [Spirosoma radiotolerans]